MRLMCALAITAALSACNGGNGETKSSLPASPHDTAPSASDNTRLREPTRVDAGKDQLITSGSNVSLRASIIGTTGEPVSYQWTQLSGPNLTLSNAASVNASFTAPPVATATRALFKVTMTDNNAKTYSDTLAINLIDASAIKRYEAEADTGVTLTSVNKATRISGFSGTGYVTGYNAEDSDATTWTINIATTGLYRVDVGYQVDGPKDFAMLVDGVQYTGKMPFIDAGFHNASIGNQWLTTGAHQFTVKGGWSYYNLDYLQLTPVAMPDSLQVVDAAPVDPQASDKTKALYQYLISQYGSKTLSGQQAAIEMDTVLGRSGKLPAIYAFDLIDYSKVATTALGSTPANQTEDFIATLNKNKQIGSLIWHWHSPTDAKNTSSICLNQLKAEPDNHCWWNSFYTKHTDFDLAKALADTNSEQYKGLIADMDRIAVQLQKTQAAGQPILWRPLHEAEGGWFWWGAKGKDNFVKLWRIMHDRFTHHHQLHNLIWVLTIGDPNWYPGDDVVDFVGVDAYPTDKHDTVNSTWDMMLERFDGHKMLVLSEFGGVPFINEMQTKGVWWGYFASWGDGDGSNPLGPKKMTTEEVNLIYNLPGVVTADELGVPKP